MEPTLVLALLAATMSLLLLGATVFLLAMVGVVVWTARGRDRAAVLRAITPVPLARVTSPDTLAPATGAPVGGPALLGFFDDESSVPGLGNGQAGLFEGRPGWDDSEEAQATEIFSAHAASGDLAEFALYEGDEATGRFSKGGEPR